MGYLKCQFLDPALKDSDFTGLSRTQVSAFLLVMLMIFKLHLRSTELELTLCSRGRVKKMKVEHENQVRMGRAACTASRVWTLCHRLKGVCRGL